MKPRFKKNISSIVTDVKNPQRGSDSGRGRTIFNLNQLGLGLVMAFFMILLVFTARDFWENLRDIDINVSDYFGSQIESYGSIGGEKINLLNEKLDNIDKDVDKLSIREELAQIPLVFNAFRDINLIIGDLDLILKEIDEKAIELSFTGRGDELIELLLSGRNKILELEHQEKLIKEQISKLEDLEETPEISSALIPLADAIQDLTMYIGSEGGKKTLILFSRRGGLSKRYSLISFNRGDIVSFSVKDLEELESIEISNDLKISLEKIPVNIMDSVDGVLLVGESDFDDSDSNQLLQSVIRELFIDNVEFYPND